MIDLHSHILPGIDDGADSFEDSLELVRELSANGVTEVFATPHYVDETAYVSPREDNLKLLDELQQKVNEAGISIKVHLGNEIYITPRILKLLKDGVISAYGDSQYLLVELPMSGEFPNYADIILELLRSSYKVVLAHPERYTSFQKDFSLVQEMFDMGVYLQCNLMSFGGKYGKGALKLAVKLAKSKMIWGLGSDIHHPQGEELWKKSLKKLAKYYNDAEREEILNVNPRKILAE